MKMVPSSEWHSEYLWAQYVSVCVHTHVVLALETHYVIISTLCLKHQLIGLWVQ